MLGPRVNAVSVRIDTLESFTRVCESSVCLFWLDRADVAVAGFESAQVLFLLQAGLGLLLLH
jgi:hypothetical protein